MYQILCSMYHDDGDDLEESNYMYQILTSMYHVKHDDGDEEDLEEWEVREAVLLWESHRNNSAASFAAGAASQKKASTTQIIVSERAAKSIDCVGIHNFGNWRKLNGGVVVTVTKNKSPGSEAYMRFQRFKNQSCIADMLKNGATTDDISDGFAKGYLQVQADLMVESEDKRYLEPLNAPNIKYFRGFDLMRRAERMTGRDADDKGIIRQDLTSDDKDRETSMYQILTGMVCVRYYSARTDGRRHL